MEGIVEPCGEVGQDACLLERADGEENAEEEEYGGHIDVLHHLGDASLDLAVKAVVVDNQLGDEPEDAKREKYAHVWRQVGDGLEHRHEQQSGHTEYQDCHRQLVVVARQLVTYSPV